MIRFLVMDVDGTLTDGKIYMGQTGELFKSFDIKDGYAIKEMLPQMGIIPVVITARQSSIVEHRCSELGIEELHQGCRHKLDRLREILCRYSAADNTSYDLSSVAYIGDDLLDLQCMEPINAEGGLTACPADAAKGVLDVAQFVSSRSGGNGAVRELVESLQYNNH